jgi:hypothetical protein
MTFRFRFTLRGILFVLVAFILVPLVSADQWNKETVVTFGRPVEVPGEVLPAGTYVFKLVDDESNRRTVQIFTENGMKLVATVMAIPDYRLVATEKPVISFEERPSGSPEALEKWFYPGDKHGVRFVYPNSHIALADNSKSTATPAATATTADTTPAPAVEAMTTPQEASSQQEEERQILAQDKLPLPTEPARLPKAAGNFLVLPLAGFGLLFAGAMLHLGTAAVKGE